LVNTNAIQAFITEPITSLLALRKPWQKLREAELGISSLGKCSRIC
jgi:hypothetical protein